MYTHFKSLTLLILILISTTTLADTGLLNTFGLPNKKTTHTTKYKLPNSILSLGIGNTKYDKKDWGEWAEMETVSIGYDTKPDGIPFHISVSYTQSQKDAYDIAVNIQSIRFGVKKHFQVSDGGFVFRPFIGAGVSKINAQMAFAGSLQGLNRNGATTSQYFEVGAMIRVCSGLNIGFVKDVSFADISLSGYDIGVGGSSARLFMGFEI